MERGLYGYPRKLVRLYESPAQAWAANVIVNFPMPYPDRPSVISPILVCQVADLAYVAGDEVEATTAFNNVGTNERSMFPWSWMIKTGEVHLHPFVATPLITQATSGDAFALVNNRWKVKVVCIWLKPPA